MRKLNKAIKAVKLLWQKLQLRGVENEIKDIKKWLDGVTVGDDIYLIVEAKDELKDLINYKRIIKTKILKLKK